MKEQLKALFRRRQRPTIAAVALAAYGAVWYRRLRVYERQPLDADDTVKQSLLLAAKAPEGKGVAAAVSKHPRGQSYADVFGVTLALPEPLLQRALERAGSASDAAAEAGAGASGGQQNAESARLTTAFARSFFSSRSFTAERCVLSYVMRLTPSPFAALQFAAPAVASGPAVVRDARALAFGVGDEPAPNIFRVVQRRPTEVLSAWGLDTTALSGLNWLHAAVLHPSVVDAGLGAAVTTAACAAAATSTAGHAAAHRGALQFPDTRLVRVAMGSCVWQFPRTRAADASVASVLHRWYSKVCLYNALRDLLGRDPTPFVVHSKAS